MAKIFNKLVAIIICVFVLSVSGIGCASQPSSLALEKQFATVQLGNLAITVSVDGNLVMPQAFDLLFGAPGNVEDVLVEEGDFVKDGQILARLDDTTQRLDIMSANNDVQTKLSNLYETVPLLPQFPEQNYELEWQYNEKTKTNEPVWADKGIKDSRTSYPFYYPNATAWVSFVWAWDEVTRARELFQAGNYAAAASELYVASSDLESCIKIFEDTINNPKSGLGNTAPFVPGDLAGITYLSILQGPSFTVSYIVELRQAVDLIKQGQADIETVRVLTAEGEYDEAGPMFGTLSKRVDKIGKAVINNVNVIKTHNYATVYGEDISIYFYYAAEEKLDAAQKG